MRPSVRLSQSYIKKKEKAKELRAKGFSYQEISDRIGVTKSTVYYWAREIKLSPAAKKRIEKKQKEALRKGLVAYNNIYSELRSKEAEAIREKYKEKAAREIKSLSRQNLKLIGTALYWAEGNTKNRNCFRFANSDPDMVKVTIKFLHEICGVSSERIKARIHLYPHTNRSKALSYWSEITLLSKKNFYKPQVQISRASKGKRIKNTLPHGTLHLTVCSTELNCKAKGWIRGLLRHI